MRKRKNGLKIADKMDFAKMHKKNHSVHKGVKPGQKVYILHENRKSRQFWPCPGCLHNFPLNLNWLHKLEMMLGVISNSLATWAWDWPVEVCMGLARYQYLASGPANEVFFQQLGKWGVIFPTDQAGLAHERWFFERARPAKREMSFLPAKSG